MKGSTAKNDLEEGQPMTSSHLATMRARLADAAPCSITRKNGGRSLISVKWSLQTVRTAQANTRQRVFTCSPDIAQGLYV